MEEKDITKEQAPTVKPEGKKVSFNRQPQTKKASRADLLTKQVMYLDKKIDVVGEKLLGIMQKLEEGIATKLNSNTLAILKVFDKHFADAPVIKEADIDPNDGKDFIPVIGLYFEHKGEIVKIVPIEEGWKMKGIKADNEEDPKVFTINFEFTGIAPEPDYPTTFSVESENPYNGVMKLREYLFSLKENKIIV